MLSPDPDCIGVCPTVLPAGVFFVHADINCSLYYMFPQSWTGLFPAFCGDLDQSCLLPVFCFYRLHSSFPGVVWIRFFPLCGMFRGMGWNGCFWFRQGCFLLCIGVYAPQEQFFSSGMAFKVRDKVLIVPEKGLWRACYMTKHRLICTDVWCI